MSLAAALGALLCGLEARCDGALLRLLLLDDLEAGLPLEGLELLEELVSVARR